MHCPPLADALSHTAREDVDEGQVACRIALAGMASAVCLSRPAQDSAPGGLRQVGCSPLKGFAGAAGTGVGALVGVFGFRLHCLHAGRVSGKP